MASRAPENYAKIRVPSWLFGGNPEGLLQHLDVYSKRLPGSPDSWSVETTENYFRRQPKLVGFERLAGPTVNGDQFHLIDTHSPMIQHTPSDQAVETIRKLGERAEISEDLIDFITYIRMCLVAAPPEQLSSIARDVHQSLIEIPDPGDSDALPLSDASSYFVWRNETLFHRLKFASMWMRFEHDEEFKAQGPQYLQQQFSAEGQLFQSSSSLYAGIYTFDAYLGPLLGSLSPWVWGFYSSNSMGCNIQTYGRTLNGIGSDAAELIQTIGIQGGLDQIPHPDFGPSSSSNAVEWYTTALNQLFATLADFSYYVDSDGYYEPTKQMHTLLSIEQLFRRITSLQLAHRDVHARRVLLFTILDTLQRLTGRPIETHCSLRFATKTLDSLRETMPSDAAQVLLPRAASSVAALKEMQAGFFMSSKSAGIHIPDIKGSEHLVDFDGATAQYIKVLRDATHGHGTNRPGSMARTNALLAHHNGDVPHDLGWLGFLYLLEFLANPNLLRDRLRPGRRYKN
ncbi:hypothetical protein ACFCV3_08480 [Kribbella sp. NPDC056345]|uniref:hypothetical protein n=1 Tax=Kribbella sp. NPDC056345 TaxID=3345789 RepID=UPI0035E03AE7